MAELGPARAATDRVLRKAVTTVRRSLVASLYCPQMASYRDRLVATLRAIEPVLAIPDVLIAGSQLPNLLERGSASTLVVSQDVDVLVPVARHDEVKRALRAIHGLAPSVDEPSVWIPQDRDSPLIEVNFIGKDPSIMDPMDTYEKPDEQLPLMVFGPLSLLVPGQPVDVDGLRIPVPEIGGAVLEKLVTDRSGEKGDRDLLVVAGLIASMGEPDLDQIVAVYEHLSPELRHAVRTNLSILSLLPARPAMPDPVPHRARIAALLARLEAP